MTRSARPSSPDAPTAATSYAADTLLRERAELLAGKLSLRPLTADEAAEAVDIIFDLLRLIDPPGEAA